MAEFEHMEEWVVGMHDRGLLGCAETTADFTKLKSERMSPHYANFRGVMSINYDLAIDGFSFDQQMRVRDLTVEAGVFVLESIRDLRNFDHLAPIPQAVTQLGGAIALKGGYSAVNVRVKEGEKGYGKHKPVEGDFKAGQVVVGFDDVVTTGETKEEFIEPISLVGLELQGFAVLLDRQEGGRVKVENQGYKFDAAVGMYVVKNILRDNGRINSEQYDFVDEYLDQYGDLAA